MVEEVFDSSEEARKGLLHEVTSLRKQSLFALVLAILFIVITVYLYFQLQERKKDLEKSNTGLKNSKVQLEAQNKKINDLNEQLNEFRQQYLKENAASQPKKYSSVGKYPSTAAVKTDTWQSCFGYIVYIQDRRGSRVSESIRQALKDKGAIVPAIEHMGERVKFSSSVRYFHREDKAMADFIQALIMKTLDSSKIAYSATQLPVSYIANDKVPLGQLEIWIDS